MTTVLPCKTSVVEEDIHKCGMCEEEQDKEYSTCCEECGLLTCEDCLKTYSGVCCRCVEEDNPPDEEEYCDEHEQVMYKDGLKCSG